MQIVSAAEMKQAEDAANARGLSYDAMMENAGRAVADAIDQQFEATGRRITVLVGPGNNGGDGLVAARYLADLGATVNLYLWKRGNLATDPNWQRLADYNLPVIHQEDDLDGRQLSALIEQSAVVIDALLGTGVSRPIAGSLAGLLERARTVIERRRRPTRPTLLDPIDPPTTEAVGPAIVAVDLPSGLRTDSGELDPLTLPADLTVTFAAPKRGHFLFPGAAYVGQLLIADIGIDPAHLPLDAPVLVTPDFITELLPERPIQGHKGTFGRVIVAAGCQDYTGAPALSAGGALRIGAGLVTVAIPAPIQSIVAAHLTEATYLRLSHEDGSFAAPAASELARSLKRYSALLVGPGLGQNGSTAQFLSDLLALLNAFHTSDAHLPALIFDADALNLLAKVPQWWTHIPAGAVLTPHPGEMSRLSGRSIAELEAERLDLVPQWAQAWGHVVLYKGAFTIVASPDGETAVMPFANPALATAGSGDVLAGCIVGLLGQGLSAFEAAVTGAYLHGLAGELARERFWESGVVASDLLPLLPIAIRELMAG